MHFPLTQDGATPLFMASKNGHSDVVNTLIRNGADVNLSGKVCTIIHNMESVCIIIMMCVIN